MLLSSSLKRRRLDDIASWFWCHQVYYFLWKQPITLKPLALRINNTGCGTLTFILLSLDTNHLLWHSDQHQTMSHRIDILTNKCVPNSTLGSKKTPWQWVQWWVWSREDECGRKFRFCGKAWLWFEDFFVKLFRSGMITWNLKAQGLCQYGLDLS